MKLDKLLVKDVLNKDSNTCAKEAIRLSVEHVCDVVLTCADGRVWTVKLEDLYQCVKLSDLPSHLPTV